MIDAKPYVAVVDDDESVRKSLHRLIRSAGLDAETFASADEFLQAVDTRAPNCLVLDVHMPNMGGLALQSELARRGDHVPIVFITAHDDESTREQALNAGAADFLIIPFDGSTFIEVIEKAMSD